MTIDIEATDATLGAVVTGIRIGEMDEKTWDAVENAFHQYGVLVFPGQHPTPDQQFAFAQRFGDIEHLSGKRPMKVSPISNRKPDGTLLAGDEHGARILRGNEGWHTDSSYMPLSAKASILTALVVPSKGGQTEWADMRAAYDALDDETRQRIEGLSAYHSLFHSQAKIGHEVAVGAGYGFYAGDKPLRPLVKTHPVTGRKALFIGRHAYGIPGLGEEESERLLTQLAEFACRPPRTYMHDWQAGDTVIWDNRCVMHRARPYDGSEPRVLQHTRIAGELATELAEGMQPQ